MDDGPACPHDRGRGVLAPPTFHADLYAPGVGEVRVGLRGGLMVEGRPASEVGSRKARTLLAVLAVAQGAPVGVDVLAEVLWADVRRL